MRQHHFDKSKISEFLSFGQYVYLDALYRRTQQVPARVQVSLKETLSASKGHKLLVRLIVKAIQLHGFQAEPVETKGRLIKEFNGRYSFAPTSGRKGSADIHATVNGRSVKIECKFGRDQQKPDQVKYQQEVEAAGGTYILCRHMDDVWQLLTNQ